MPQHPPIRLNVQLRKPDLREIERIEHPSLDRLFTVHERTLNNLRSAHMSCPHAQGKDGDLLYGRQFLGAPPCQLPLASLEFDSPSSLKLRSEERRVGKECRSRWS